MGKRTKRKFSRQASGNRNRFTHLRDEFLVAFEEMGGREALVKLAESNPDQFYKLVVQLLLKEWTVDMTTRTATLEDLLIELGRKNDYPFPPLRVLSKS
jgi:hypothetical protein